MKLSKSYIIYLLFLVLVALGVAEGFTRLKHQKSYLASNIQKDRVFHHLLPPHTQGTMQSEGDFDDTFVTNDRGMRGPGDYAYEKKPGTYRIAVMGDSYTFGVGVKADETYASRLQQKLQTLPVGPYEVLNFGVSSFSPVLELIYFKKEVLKYKPDLLILALDGCDIQDDFFYEKNLVRDARGEIIACDPYRRGGWPDVGAYLKKYSMLATMLDEKLLQSIKKMNTIGMRKYFDNKRKGLRTKTLILSDPVSDSIAFDRFLFTREGKDPAVVRRHWERTAGYLEAIHELCKANGVKFILAFYPYGHDVGETQWAKGRQYWAFEQGRVYDPSFAFGLVGSFAKDKSIPYVSLLEPMRLHKDRVLYYNNDGHWTAAGHEVAADAIYDSQAFQESIVK